MIVAFAGRVARGAASFRSRIRLQRRLAGIRKNLEFRPKFSKFRFLACLAYAQSCMQVSSDRLRRKVPLRFWILLHHLLHHFSGVRMALYGNEASSKAIKGASCDGMGGGGSWSSCSAARTAAAAAPGTPSTRASGSRRPSARTRARCGRGCIRLGARGSSSATGGPGHDDGPVLALELRDWAPRRRPCRAAALRARQLPQLYRVAPPCGRLRHAPAQRVGHDGRGAAGRARGAPEPEPARARWGRTR